MPLQALPEIQLAPDHDLLTTLNTKFTIFLEQYKKDMVELKEGFTSRLAENEKKTNDHEQRIVKIEQRQQQGATTANIVRVLTGIIGGLVWFIITQLPGTLRSWGLL